MKKIMVVLLGSSALLMSGCYSTPEFKVNAQRQAEGELAITCGTQEELYQHSALKACVESKQKMLDENKKTVYITQDVNGNPLVVPKACGDQQMMEKNRVYPVVDIRDKAIVEEEGNAPEEILNEKKETEVAVDAENSADEEPEESTEVEEENVEEPKVEQNDTKTIVEEKTAPIATPVDMNGFLKENQPIPSSFEMPEKVDEIEPTLSPEGNVLEINAKNEKEDLPLEEK